jgi:hypothetical protein
VVASVAADLRMPIGAAHSPLDADAERIEHAPLQVLLEGFATPGLQLAFERLGKNVQVIRAILELLAAAWLAKAKTAARARLGDGCTCLMTRRAALRLQDVAGDWLARDGESLEGGAGIALGVVGGPMESEISFSGMPLLRGFIAPTSWTAAQT